MHVIFFLANIHNNNKKKRETSFNWLYLKCVCYCYLSICTLLVLCFFFPLKFKKKNAKLNMRIKLKPASRWIGFAFAVYIRLPVNKTDGCRQSQTKSEKKNVLQYTFNPTYIKDNSSQRRILNINIESKSVN